MTWLTLHMTHCTLRWKSEDLVLDSISFKRIFGHKILYYICHLAWFTNRVQTSLEIVTTEPRHYKTNKMTVRPAKTQFSLGIRPVWSESSLCAHLVDKDPSFLHADSEDSDQTGRMPSLIRVFVGRTLILLLLSCHGSFVLVCVWCLHFVHPEAKETQRLHHSIWRLNGWKDFVRI